jgi:ABC-type amino acid transport substrate-binding protein
MSDRFCFRHPKRRLLLVGLILAGLVVAHWALFRPGGWFGPQDITWHRVQVNRDLYVGIDPSYPPFAEWTPEHPIGLEADIANEIGRRLGVETHLLIMGYDGLYSALYIGDVDLLISGLRVDPAYSVWVHYTQPYYDAGPILVSRVGAPVQNIKQLDGKTVAVEMASTGDQAAQRWKRRLHSLNVARYMLPDEAMQAVASGQVDAALVDTISARLYLKQHPDLVMADHTTVSEGYVIAMRKKNYRLTEEVDRVLADMIRDGTLDAIIARWL